MQVGNTALIAASRAGHLDVANRLLEWEIFKRKKRSSVVEKLLGSRLVETAKRGLLSVLKVLLSNGAPVNFVDEVQKCKFQNILFFFFWFYSLSTVTVYF